MERIKYAALVASLVLLGVLCGLYSMSTKKPKTPQTDGTQTVILQNGTVAEVPDTKAQTLSGVTELNAPRTEQAPQTVEVTVNEDGFQPQAVYVAQRATVTWKNTGSRPHQIRIITNPYASSPAFADLTSPLLQPGETYQYTFDNTGLRVASVGYRDGQQSAHKGSVAFEQQ